MKCGIQMVDVFDLEFWLLCAFKNFECVLDNSKNQRSFAHNQ